MCRIEDGLYNSKHGHEYRSQYGRIMKQGTRIDLRDQSSILRDFISFGMDVDQEQYHKAKSDSTTENRSSNTGFEMD